ncbi:GNAT family N-acetyltransferase [Amycolatopsis sp. NPDC059021]|uniref:GNAT family N-acetyltransferase n=1 Tax=Amycolatopsis sp. NPDC059021 TaxID=3346704 RepID=UPI00366DE1DA
MSAPGPRAAEPSEMDVLVQVLTAAFHDDPVDRWIFPDAGRRREAHPVFFSVLLEAAFDGGRVDVSDDLTALVLWLPGGDEALLDGFAALKASEQDRLEVVFELLGERAPARPGYWQAQFAAVRPDRQREGLGGRLFRYGLDRYDAAGAPTYLVSSSAGSARLYRRLGYRDLGEAFRLPGGSAMRPMWRDPC